MLRITYDARKLKKIQQLLAELPHGSKSVVVPAINEYLMGGGSGEGGTAYHGLKHYPPFKSAWDSAHPYRQQYPRRTGELQRGWRTIGESYRQKITNTVPYAGYIHGDETQVWRARFGNWRTVSKIIADNIKGALRHAKSKLSEWIKSKH